MPNVTKICMRDYILVTPTKELLQRTNFISDTFTSAGTARKTHFAALTPKTFNRNKSSAATPEKGKLMQKITANFLVLPLMQCNALYLFHPAAMFCTP